MKKLEIIWVWEQKWDSLVGHLTIFSVKLGH